MLMSSALHCATDVSVLHCSTPIVINYSKCRIQKHLFQHQCSFFFAVCYPSMQSQVVDSLLRLRHFSVNKEDSFWFLKVVFE